MLGNNEQRRIPKERVIMETTLSPSAFAEETAISCPVCGRPAQATVLRKLIAQIFCRRCHAVWQVAAVSH